MLKRVAKPVKKKSQNNASKGSGGFGFSDAKKETDAEDAWRSARLTQATKLGT